MWVLRSQTVIEPTPFVLEGNVLTIGPPGKSLESLEESPLLASPASVVYSIPWLVATSLNFFLHAYSISSVYECQIALCLL